MRILYNARIYTQDTRSPHVSALAIVGDRIFATGSDEDILNLAGPNDQKHDMHGQVIWPGLTDAHMHLEYYARGLKKIDCETSSRAECLRRVSERVQQTPSGAWVLGHGWNQNTWPESFGDGHDLDRIAPNHPVYLTAKSLHASWANQTALQQAGIGAGTPDPEGGRIERDASGQPTGFLFESAMELLDKVVPEPDETELGELIVTAQTNLWSMGLTGLHDFDHRSCFAALQILDQAGKLRLRVVKSVPLDLLQHAAALGLRSGFGSPYLRIGSVKLFADGALGPQTAAMLQPYENDPVNSGMLFLDSEQIFEYGQKAAASGLSLAIHAIGDRANHQVIEGYQQLRAYETEHHLPHLRHRIEHVQIIHPDDQPRLAENGIVASMQPIHATSDMYIADKYWGARSSSAYVFNSLLEMGGAVVFGSDAPVESPNPFLGLHAAVTRRRPDGTPGPDGWYPQQRMRLEDALHAYTTGPAYACGQEHQLGRLQAGYYADCTVLDVDPFTLPTADLYTVSPSAVMVAGQWVWQV